MIAWEPSCHNSLTPPLCSVPRWPNKDVRILLVMNIHGGPCPVALSCLGVHPQQAATSTKPAWAAARGWLCCVARRGQHVCCGSRPGRLCSRAALDMLRCLTSCGWLLINVHVFCCALLKALPDYSAAMDIDSFCLPETPFYCHST